MLSFVKMDPKAGQALKEGGVVKPAATAGPTTTAASLKDGLHLLDKEVTDGLSISFDEFSVMMLSLARR